ncbi:ras-related GTP-binding protein C [Harpia harpyja]|nr:ras-related GTP-binding protein C [Accipiter gentilis]XP_052666355.1 ras-related GTP-binding protein C [Harpia harpyja]NWZ53520.1 RRAGC protein [Haliaeetus albicilla]NXF31236.1 RRAGC protein [Nyctibius bracteatus]NXW16968.1 RRAGC protein [Circaetus pectoralis]
MALQFGGAGAAGTAEEPALVGGSFGAADSFPKDFGYGEEEEEAELEGGPGPGGPGGGAGGPGGGAGGADSKPRILLMGLRRSGKSSIQKVVFHKMSPNETLFLESTNKIYKDDISNSSFVNFQIWDFPGQMDFFDPTFDYEMIFRGTGALIYVIDAQDDYMEALTRLHITVSKAYKVNPEMNFEVFIHKVDGLSDDHKIETQRDIHQRANDDLTDAGLEKLHLSFYLTSIYDHSIFEAFSKVVQKLIPQLPTLENLLNIFISNSGIEKAFLFDVVSKIYIATDSSPVDMQSYELCCDMIDVVIDVSCIYGLKEDGTGSAYDKESMAIIKLNNTTVLYLKEVTKFLALVCILREESFERKGLIDYNFHCFRKAIHEVFEVGVASHRICNHQSSTSNMKAVTHNGTPRNAV